MELGHIPIEDAEMRQVFASARQKPVTVVGQDGEAVVVLSAEEFDKLCTTADLMNSAEIVARYRAYKDQAASGDLEFVSGDEAERLLKLRQSAGS